MTIIESPTVPGAKTEPASGLIESRGKKLLKHYRNISLLRPNDVHVWSNVLTTRSNPLEFGNNTDGSLNHQHRMVSFGSEPEENNMNHNIRAKSALELLLYSAISFSSRGSDRQLSKYWYPRHGVSTIEKIHPLTLEPRYEMWLSPACLLLASSNLRETLCDDIGQRTGRSRRRRRLEDSLHHNQRQYNNDQLHLSVLEELLLSVYLFHFGTEYMFNFGTPRYLVL
jgi:hypothetical protein